MEEPCQNWFSDMEIQDVDFLNQHHKIVSLGDEDQIFREIMHRPAFSSESESHSPTNQNKSAAALEGGNGSTVAKNSRDNNLMMKDNNSSNNFIFSQHALEKPANATSPTAYILSFGDSTVVAATRHQTYGGNQPYHEQVGFSGGGTCPPPSKGISEKLDLEPRVNQTTRKTRSSAETLDHIMAERKRRRELTERFIALSATIPGLKKIDKATILSEAIIHVKRLKERVRELEEQSKKTRVESVSFIQKSHLSTENKGTTLSGAMNSTDDCYRTNEALPTVEARVFKKDVLLRIHCKIQSGILLKILAHLKSLDLSTISNSVLPFGSSTLDISIVAQMGDKFSVAMDDLVTNLRLALLESSEVQSDPC
ncbi:transcription factor bHLH18-like [Gastrolobium bilobum]|uniref:transcription factor bHLH18-like n=1 Tax=Gastrolobium bilobum TaxID=150636 RepID=UPI002AAF33F6|nr:transcription factor bHLH18-like [Gastrolobium bilobum]